MHLSLSKNCTGSSARIVGTCILLIGGYWETVAAAVNRYIGVKSAAEQLRVVPVTRFS